MKRILFVLAALLVPALLSAQETYPIAATANQQARVERRRVKTNGNTCLRLNAVGGATCTQAQACTAAGAAGGASCTAVQARAASAEIFANSLAGRQTMLEQTIILPAFTDYQKQTAAEDQTGFCVWWKATATQPQKDAICTGTSPSLGAACELCQ
jgi:hypothetical protein